MSILDKEIQQDNNAVLVSADILRVFKSLFNHMIDEYRHATNLFWRNSKATPQEIVNVFGEDAGEVFQKHYALGQLLSSLDAEQVNEINQVIGNFTQNEDGTVTIIQ